MAHEVETMAYANQVPWHGLGAQVGDNLTPDEMLVAAGLDWTVERRPLFAMDDEGMVPVPERYALMRSSDRKVLSVISERWNPLQNRDVLGFMQTYVAAGGAKLETAGSLKGGKLIWGLANLSHSFDVAYGDRVQGYLLFVSPHEPGRAISIRTTTVRVVCANTLALAERGGQVNYSQTHSTKFNEKAARERVGEAHEQLAQAERQAKILHKLKLSAEDAVRKVLAPTFKPEVLEDRDLFSRIMEPSVMPKVIAGPLHSIRTSPGAEPDTGWGVLNGVTHYLDHVAGRGQDTRLSSAWTGDGARQKLHVQQLLLELAM